jgi:glyoxylase-like metal-dependent hydrolase (beta-lactamase superfamily II)
MRTRAALLLIVLAWAEPVEYIHPAPEVIEVANGISCFMSKPYGDVGLDGNSVAIQLLHYDRAVTPGDTLLFLPAEKIVISGDLLVNPISFALSSYPSGWLLFLERVEALVPPIIIPGHGKPLHDLTLLRAHIQAMRIMLAAGADARTRGLDADQAKDEVLPKLRALMVTMTGDDATLNSQFRTYLVDWYMHRVYEELSGPLSDAISPIPAK